MNAFNLYEAYAAVYDEDLREDILTVEEDFSFIDDLSDNELDQVMEEILSEGVELSECFEVFEELIVEMNPYAPAGSKEAKAYAKSTTKSKRSAEASERRAARVERIKGAAKRAGEAVKSRASEVKGGVVSGAKSAIGGAKAAKAKVSGKLASAKEKIKGFLGKVGRAAKAGASAAKKEFSGEAGREASARTTGRQMRRSARQQASAERGRDTSAFEKPKEKTGKEIKDAAKSAVSSARKPAPYRMVGRAGSTRVASGSGATKALPPVGMNKAGKPLTQSQRDMQTSAQNNKLSKRLGEDLELLASYILEDLINEGYAKTFEEALNVLETFSDYEVGEIAENYLVEEVETVDLYDVVLEHLLDEGFADTEDAATVIMANMSEEWREEILDEAGRMHSSSDQQAGFARITSGEVGFRGKKPMSDEEIAAQPGGQKFLDRIKKTKSDPRYKD